MRRWSALVIAGAAVALLPVVQSAGMSGAGESGGAQVGIGYADYKPPILAVLTGEPITWTNNSVRGHTVTDDGGAFDSGTIGIGATFKHAFDAQGRFAYHCRLHPSIRGEIDVSDLLLDPPPQPAEAGASFPLSGRAALPADTAVAIEADDGVGGAFREVAHTAVAADHTFNAQVKPAGTASYRAVAGDSQSPAVQLIVLNHVVMAAVRNGRRASVVSVRVTPADPGATVVLQLHLRERFGWWLVRRIRLPETSQVRFALSVRRPVSARVLLTLPDGATALATSSNFRVGRR